MAGLPAVVVIWIVALGDGCSRQLSSTYLFGGHIHSAEAYGLRPKETEIIGEPYETIHPKMGNPSIDVVNLRPIESLIYRPEVNVAPTLRWDDAASCKCSCRIIGFVGQGHASPYSDSRFAKKSLCASVVDDADIDGDWLIGDDRSRIDAIKLRIDRSALTLNKSPSLNCPDNCQNNSKDANYASPPDHIPVKGIFLLGVLTFGAWIGVWSVAFWDRLGFWRWIVSGLGWAFMVFCIVQGLPIRP